MAVYYKFKSAKDFDSIPIEGQFISVANLKERIFETKHLGGTDFDLMVSNAQTDEEYVDEAAMIPKNTSVLIRRIPGRSRKHIVIQQEEPKLIEDKVDAPPPNNSLTGEMPTMRYPDESEWEEFGTDLYAIPESNSSQPSNPAIDISSAMSVDEDSKIKALVDSSAFDWNRQTQEAYGGGRGFGRGMGGRMMAGRGRGGFERRTPPAGYVCHRCKVPGHFIQHCPTNGDPNYDVKRTKPPTGIPKSMLVATPDGSYALPSGAVAVLRPNEAAFEKEIEGLPTTRTVSDLPPELRCPLCNEVMKDAVLTSKCCFSSFCDKCIRDYVINNGQCVCGATHVLADDLLPNKTVRDTIIRILESTTSSTENAGYLVQVQDMESSLPAQQKVPSPTLSAASKDEPKHLSLDNPTDVKKRGGRSETKALNSDIGSSEKNPAVSASEPVPEPMTNELKSPGQAAVAEEIQGKQVTAEQGKKKKKKKTRIAGNAADMQWKSYQDLGPGSFAGMPLAPPGYNQYWPGGMPMGMDGYMGPIGATVPYMGYNPGPFDFAFGGGFLPQEPFAAQGYMMPFGSRDLSDFGMNPIGMNNMGINQGPPMMTREEFEARKAEMRRKRQMDRRGEWEREYSNREREHSNDREPRRESSSINDVASMKSKPSVVNIKCWQTDLIGSKWACAKWFTDLRQFENATTLVIEKRKLY